jgi:hypothetical protein
MDAVEGLDQVRALGFEVAWLERGDSDAERLVEVASLADMRIERFAEKQMLRGHCQITPRSLVIGGLPSVKSALRVLGRELPPSTDYPDALTPFLRRQVWRSTLAAAQSAFGRTGQPIFVKPVGIHKRFTGVVIDSGESWPLASVPGRTPVWCSEVVTFQSEHRAFVSNRRIVGVRHYWGDPGLSPERETISTMVATFGADAPDSYALDVGIVPSGDTALVEVTDGFALDSYGLEPDLYLTVLAPRWRQLVGTPTRHP